MGMFRSQPQQPQGGQHPGTWAQWQQPSWQMGSLAQTPGFSTPANPPDFGPTYSQPVQRPPMMQPAPQQSRSLDWHPLSGMIDGTAGQGRNDQFGHSIRTMTKIFQPLAQWSAHQHNPQDYPDAGVLGNFLGRK